VEEKKAEEKKSFGWPKTEYTAFKTPHNAWGTKCPLIPPKAKIEPEKQEENAKKD